MLRFATSHDSLQTISAAAAPSLTITLNEHTYHSSTRLHRTPNISGCRQTGIPVRERLVLDKTFPAPKRRLRIAFTSRWVSMKQRERSMLAMLESPTDGQREGGRRRKINGEGESERDWQLRTRDRSGHGVIAVRCQPRKPTTRCCSRRLCKHTANYVHTIDRQRRNETRHAFASDSTRTHEEPSRESGTISVVPQGNASRCSRSSRDN